MKKIILFWILDLIFLKKQFISEELGELLIKKLSRKKTINFDGIEELIMFRSLKSENKKICLRKGSCYLCVYDESGKTYGFLKLKHRIKLHKILLTKRAIARIRERRF